MVVLRYHFLGRASAVVDRDDTLFIISSQHTNQPAKTSRLPHLLKVRHQRPLRVEREALERVQRDENGACRAGGPKQDGRGEKGVGRSGGSERHPSSRALDRSRSIRFDTRMLPIDGMGRTDPRPPTPSTHPRQKHKKHAGTREGVDGPLGEAPGQGVEQRRLVQVGERDEVLHHGHVLLVPQLQVRRLRLARRHAVFGFFDPCGGLG